MKKVIIVHGSNSKEREKVANGEAQQNERHWIPWIKIELEKQEIKCFNPLMPENWSPKYEDWKNEIEKKKIDENSILIGHSSGGAFLVRWLGETKRKIKKLILVAPCKSVGKWNWYCKDFYNFEIDSSIRNTLKEVIIFVSDNEMFQRIEDAKVYSQKLNGKLINLSGKGHFIKKHMGTEEFPELLEEVLK